MISGSPNLLKLLLEDERIDVNARDEMGYTALFHQYYNEDTTIEEIQILLDSPRIDVSILDCNGELPLHMASYNLLPSRDVPRVEVFLKSAIKKGRL